MIKALVHDEIYRFIRAYWAKYVVGKIGNARPRLRKIAAPAIPLIPLLTCPTPLDADSFESQRAAMVDIIQSYREEAARVLGPRGFDPQVLTVMRTVPRHAFIPASEQRHAYDDRPVPIGYGQTISQPLIVALMTDLLQPKPDHVILEVGTGSGYQAAVLAHLVRQVYTIEIVAPLAAQAKAQLAELGYKNVEVRSGDGYAGWKEAGPFDGILVTAGADHIPQPLIEQLKPGARMVIPVGSRYGAQYLMLVEAAGHGKFETRKLLGVRFVPLTRQ